MALMPTALAVASLTQTTNSMLSTSLSALKTTLKQQGNEIVLENDCRDYLSGLNEVIEGDMGIVFSSWDNTNGIESFELD